MSTAVGWGTVTFVGAASALLALWLRSLGIFSAGAAMIALRASAPFGAPASIDAIGFDLPPLPIVLAMPAAALPALRWDPLGPAMVSAVASGAAAWWLFGALRAMGLGAAASAALTLGLAAPAWLYAAASGSGTVLASALLVGALRLHRRWQETGDALAILTSAFAVALAGLARYDLFLVGWAIAVLVALGPRARPDEPRDERPAFSVAYATAVTGLLGLWVVATGAVTGDALGFIGGSHDAMVGPAAAQLPVHALAVMLPALALAAIAVLLRRGHATAVSAVVISASVVGASVVSGSPVSLDAVVPLIPVSVLLLGEIVAARRALRPILTLAVPALIATGALGLALSSDWGEGHRAAIDGIAGRSRPMWTGERDLAAHLHAAGGRVVIDERIDGVVSLLVSDLARGEAPRSTRVLDLVAAAVASRPGAPAPGSARPGDAPAADLVLVRTPSGRGSAHRVAAAWPTLYGGGAPWATLAGSWPVGGEPAEYRLYSVRPVPLP